MALTYSPLGDSYGGLLWGLAMATMLTGLLLVYKARHDESADDSDVG